MSEPIKSPARAIRAFCLQCVDGAAWVLKCDNTACPLWPFRLGKNPFHTRTTTDEQKAAAAERLKAYRAAQENGNGA